jgi:hypothetical protein
MLWTCGLFSYELSNVASTYLLTEETIELCCTCRFWQSFKASPEVAAKGLGSNCFLLPTHNHEKQHTKNETWVLNASLSVASVEG